MDFWSSIDGMVEVEITSAEPELLLASIIDADIEIQNLRKESELTYFFRIKRQAYLRLRQICEKRGGTAKIRKKLGIHWMISRGMKRPILLTGSILLLALAAFIPTRVYFISVEGNHRIPDRKILAAAEECGIAFGASRRQVRSEKVKNELLSSVPELEWAGINTKGCTAEISVREKAAQPDTSEDSGIQGIEAARDGYILSCTVTGGTSLVKPGDSVSEGQLLISPYTDCGLCLRAENAEGEVFAQTYRKIETIMASGYSAKGDSQSVKRKFSLLFRKKRIFLWKDSGIWDASCGRMYEEYYVTLPGGFQLPFALCVEEYFHCDTRAEELSEREAAGELKHFAKSYLTHLMTAGKINQANQLITLESGAYRLRGSYICTEMIARVRQEQIGDRNGKNS